MARPPCPRYTPKSPPRQPFKMRWPCLLPSDYDVFIEPFLGSGAVFFYLEPRKAILDDSNDELIAAYRAIKSDPAGLFRYLKAHHRDHSGEHYYAVRSARDGTGVCQAARFVYLNRTCFNGIYRVNLAGVF